MDACAITLVQEPITGSWQIRAMVGDHTRTVTTEPSLDLEQALKCANGLLFSFFWDPVQRKSIPRSEVLAHLARNSNALDA